MSSEPKESPEDLDLEKIRADFHAAEWSYNGGPNPASYAAMNAIPLLIAEVETLRGLLAVRAKNQIGESPQGAAPDADWMCEHVFVATDAEGFRCRNCGEGLPRLVPDVVGEPVAADAPVRGYDEGYAQGCIDERTRMYIRAARVAPDGGGEPVAWMVLIRKMPGAQGRPLFTDSKNEAEFQSREHGGAEFFPLYLHSAPPVADAPVAHSKSQRQRLEAQGREFTRGYKEGYAFSADAKEASEERDVPDQLSAASAYLRSVASFPEVPARAEKLTQLAAIMDRAAALLRRTPTPTGQNNASEVTESAPKLSHGDAAGGEERERLAKLCEREAHDRRHDIHGSAYDFRTIARIVRAPVAHTDALEALERLAELLDSEWKPDAYRQDVATIRRALRSAPRGDV